MGRNTTTTKPAAKPAAKPARGKRSAKPAPVEPATVESAPVEPATVESTATGRQSWIAEYNVATAAAVASGETKRYAPYARDADTGTGNKRRMYVAWCRHVADTGTFPQRDALAAIAIAANATGVQPTTIAGWVSHWLRHPACRPGGRANGIPADMRVHRIDPQFHGYQPGSVLSDDVRAAMRAAIAAYDASLTKRTHDAADA